jgi:hypothetical protein
MNTGSAGTDYSLEGSCSFSDLVEFLVSLFLFLNGIPVAPAAMADHHFVTSKLTFDMDRNFVCLWRRHNCRNQVIDLSLFFFFLIYEINCWVFKQF